MKPGDIIQLSKEGREASRTNIDGLTMLWWGRYLNRVGFISAMANKHEKEEGEYLVSWSLDPDDSEFFYGCEIMKKEHIIPFNNLCTGNHDHVEVIVGNYDNKGVWADWPWPTRWLEDDGMVRTYDTAGNLKHTEPLHA